MTFRVQVRIQDHSQEESEPPNIELSPPQKELQKQISLKPLAMDRPLFMGLTKFSRFMAFKKRNLTYQ